MLIQIEIMSCVELSSRIPFHLQTDLFQVSSDLNFHILFSLIIFARIQHVSVESQQHNYREFRSGRFPFSNFIKTELNSWLKRET